MIIFYLSAIEPCQLLTVFMTFRKFIYLLIISFVIIGSFTAEASPGPGYGIRKSRNQGQIQDTLSWSLSIMKKVFNSPGEWYLTHETYRKSVRGVIDYAENPPIDTVVVNLNQLLRTDTIPLIFKRNADAIPDKRIVPGYLAPEELDRLVENRRKAVADSIRKSYIIVPESYLSAGMSRVSVIPSGDPQKWLGTMDQTFPAAFISRFYKGWGNLILPANVTPAEMDTLKSRLFNLTRQEFNDSLLFSTRDSLILHYRENFISQASDEAGSRKRSFLSGRNRDLLNTFNESEVVKVNDSLRVALRYLTDRAAYDSTKVTLTNISGVRSHVWTANRPMSPMRMFLKNEQNDSLSVILYNDGKGGLKMVIDDAVQFTRFKESQKREVTFSTKKPDGDLHQINLRHIDPLPWKLYGTGAVGFTQTSLSNWAKGGESSLSLLLIGKYVANYSKKSVKWENLAEFRLGIFNSKTRGLEKNDDKLELQSRFGYSAFKHWYYSGESNFRTQVANGYKYPDKVNPISAFMAPAYLTFSIGMDYKPNKNFSMFLSPFTSKTTFVKDTVKIDPTHYGLDPGKNRLWEPGAIAKMNWHYKVYENILYDTRAEIFNSYKFPFRKFNVDWEQTLVMEVTQHISTRINTQVIYDYNVKFPVVDEAGKVIAQKAKWQFKELFTVGFNYKF